MKIQNATATAVDALLTKQQLGKILSVSRATIDRWVRENPDFPQPRRITAQTIRWRMSDVARFIAGLPRVEYDDHAFDPNDGVDNDLPEGAPEDGESGPENGLGPI